jgi:coiled-coil domain-containing protein 12
MPRAPMYRTSTGLVHCRSLHSRYNRKLDSSAITMASHASLDAAATERKARLAKLKSLKRKQPPTDSEEIETSEPATLIPTESSRKSTPEPATQYLSGRNYDPETRGPKLGFENAPNENAETLEERAAAIALETKENQEKEGKEEKPIDLFQLQPKKPNWDLKRDVARKMEVLNARTENAIARLVRERIEGQKKKEKENANGSGGTDKENLGMGGVELVEGMHVREREEQEDERREREDDEDMA